MLICVHTREKTTQIGFSTIFVKNCHSSSQVYLYVLQSIQKWHVKVQSCLCCSIIIIRNRKIQSGRQAVLLIFLLELEMSGASGRGSRQFKSFEFGNGSRMSYLNLDISRTKNGKNKRKKCQNTEQLQNILTICILLRQLIKSRKFPSKLADFQHLPRFCSIREAPWMQIFIFL